MKVTPETINYLKSKLYKCDMCGRYTATIRIWFGIICDDCHQKIKLERRAVALLSKSLDKQNDNVNKSDF